MFRTEYALWTPGGCKCRGELLQIANGGGLRFEMQARRRTQKHPEGEGWPGNYKYVDGPKKGQPVEPCGDGCPDLERGDCRPSGDLYFILEKFPMFGAICRLHTSSYRSVRNLSNGLMQIRRLNGGRLTGIKAILKATPEKICYSDRDGTRHTSLAYILSLEIGATNLRSLVANMTEPVRLLGAGHSATNVSQQAQVVIRETEAERAQEIAREFYPNGDAAADEPAGSSVEQNKNSEQLARICELGQRLGYNAAKTKMLLGQSAGDLAGLERKLRNELDERPQTPSVGHSTGGRGRQNGDDVRRNNEAAPSNTPAEPHCKQQTSPTNGFLY